MTSSRCQRIWSWQIARSRGQRPWAAALMQPGGRAIPAAAAISAAKVTQSLVKGVTSYAHGSTFFCSVSDPYSFDPDLDPAFEAEYRSESRVLMTKNLKKITAEKKYFFDKKLQFTYP
jgi:hypothetical protein